MTSKSKASRRLLYCAASTMRMLRVDAELLQIVDESLRMRHEAGLVVEEFEREGLAVGKHQRAAVALAAGREKQRHWPCAAARGPVPSRPIPAA